MNVPVGLGTIVGYLLTFIGTVATAWATAEGTHVISPGELAALTTAAGMFTTLGRMYQAPKPALAAQIPILATQPPVGQSVAKTVEGP